MTSQAMPSGIETLVFLCCGEYAAVDAGWDISDGPNAWVGGSVAGLYQAFATIPFRESFGTETPPEEVLYLPDTLTDLNTVVVTPLPWTDVQVGGASFAADVFGPDPERLTARFDGGGEFTVTLGLTGGTAGEACRVWVLKNGTTDLVGSGVAVFGADGFGTVSFTATDPAVVIGDFYEVVGQSTGTPSSSVFADDVWSNWVARRVDLPRVSGRLAVYDSADTFIMDVDTDVVMGFEGTMRFASLVPLTDHGRVKVFVTHDCGVDLTVTDDVHMDLSYIVGPPPVVADCGGGGG